MSEQAEFHKFAYDKLPQGIWGIRVEYDDSGGYEFRFIFLNEAYEKEVGLRHADVVGKKPHDVLEDATAIAVEERYAQCVESQVTISFMEYLVLAGRGDYWSTILTPELEDGRVSLIFGTTTKITAQIQIEQKLRTALTNKDIKVWYQPICYLGSSKLIGYEALVRWPSTELSPGIFLPIAQKSGLMGKINELVVHDAAKQLEKLPDELWIAINLNEFKVDDLIERVLNRYDISRKRLLLEITEDAELDEEAIADIIHLKEKHLIELDDFGTVSSNFERLEQIPCDAIKIDKRFVQEVHCSPRKQAFCLACMDVAKKLNLQVVAEGIELEKDRDWLIQNDCQYGQGYLYGKAKSLS